MRVPATRGAKIERVDMPPIGSVSGCSAVAFLFSTPPPNRQHISRLRQSVLMTSASPCRSGLVSGQSA